jgi:peptidoglycan/LPS O-acetylase OafA/YrhL
VINKEIKSLTGIRGIAALFVAFHHSLINDFTRLSPPAINFISKGYLSVDLFFSLSGFVMMLSSAKYFNAGVNKKNYLNFMYKRFARVYPVYILLTTAVFVANSFHPGKAYLASLILSTTLFNVGHIIGVTWSLSAEWVIYLMFPVICLILNTKLFKGKCLHILPLISIVLLILYRFDLSILQLKYEPFHGIQPIIRCLANYLLGVYAFLITNNILKYNGRLNILTTIVASSIVTLLFFKGTNNFIVLLFPILIGLLYLDTGVISAFLSSKLIYFLGLISYSLYLIHLVVLKFKGEILAYIAQYSSNELTKLVVFNTLFLIVIVVVSTLMYKYVEIPAQRYLKAKLKV